MKKVLIGLSIVLLACATSLSAQPLTRMVFFNLKHEAGSPEAKAFFKKALVLKEIPSLSGFQIRQVEGKQFEFDYVIELEFEDPARVQDYVDHHIHRDFLKEEWPSNVSGGMLIDLKEMTPAGQQGH